MARKYQAAVRSGHTILLIDDSPEILLATKRLLEVEGHRVITAPDGPAGLALAETERPHLILVDYFMPGMTGEEVVRRVRERDRLVQIVLATGYSGEKPARVMMRQLDIQGYHDKSEGTERLLLWVDAALKAYRGALSMEKHRVGLRYILDITPDLHRLQPIDELLQGLLWQVEGLLGAENSFLATYSSDEIERSLVTEPEGFIALTESGEDPPRQSLEIRFGTGRFRNGIATESLPEPERSAVKEAVASGGVCFNDGISVVPLRLGERTLGVIYLDRRPGYERDRELLEIFASQAAAAIQNALLYGKNEMLLDLATRDNTTRVFRRGYVLQQMNQHLKRAHRIGHPVSVLMIDLNKFKQINDEHGHLVGDQALRAVGDLLQETVRETDCVGRYGGDEFIVVLPDAPEAGAHSVAERILERAACLTVQTESGEVPVRMSVGCSTVHPGDSTDYGLLRMEVVERVGTEMIARADEALYAAKGQSIPGVSPPFTWTEMKFSAVASVA